MIFKFEKKSVQPSIIEKNKDTAKVCCSIQKKNQIKMFLPMIMYPKLAYSLYRKLLYR